MVYRLIQGSPNTAREAVLSIIKKQYIYVKLLDLVECNISRNNYIT